jgi:DNA repair photolyase
MQGKDTQVPSEGRRGRGTVSNASGRFERETRHRFDDGWDSAAEPVPPLRTELTEDKSRSIIARNDSPDVPFEQSINPYRGCEHGCVYCFARPTHTFLGLSAGLDFESRLFFKPRAAELLEAELRRPGYRCRTIAMGTNTDPYQPVEQRFEITRAILEVMLAYRHPVSIVTKSQSILRDLDILSALAAERLVKVGISVTTLDRGLARAMEPRAATPERRLAAMRRLSQAGIPTGLMLAPVIPAINEAEIEAIVAAAAAAGAVGAGYVLLRLPLEIKQLWREWLAEHYPDRAERVMSLIRQTRGGREYDAAFGSRMRGQGPYAALIRRRFKLALKRHGLDREAPPLDASRFAPPPRPGDQLSLL